MGFRRRNRTVEPSRLQGKLLIEDIGRINVVSIENGLVKLTGNVLDQIIDAWLEPGSSIILGKIKIEIN